jgi:diguanylate cyclase (GGDEF)-like protein
MTLNERERAHLALQGELTRIALPLQEQVIDLVSADFNEDAKALAIGEAIPAQNRVMEALSQLDLEAHALALAASSRAHQAHELARRWMLALSGAALLVGLVVAAVVLHYTHRVGREREHLATHDALTGLPNRMLFMDRLEQSLVRARRHDTLVGVMFIDLDRFKRVNDTLGHAQGDQLICEVARRLRENVHPEDVVARLGGDEFVVVISDADALVDILQRVETILAGSAGPYHLLGREIFSSCSIGVSVYPHDGGDSATLLKHADTAMYQAKQQGRNRFQMYDPAMNAMAEERLQLETDLHHALAASSSTATNRSSTCTAAASRR